LNSNFQADISFTIASKSGPTVPALGFGIKPFGHNTLAILPKCLIIVGVATQTSKFKGTLPLDISSINSTPQAISAQAAFNSSAFPSVKAQIFEVFPEPFGREIVDLTIWSACLGSIFKLKCISIVGSNLTVLVFSSNSTASSIE
jgi:hypothetical protein